MYLLKFRVYWWNIVENEGMKHSKTTSDTEKCIIMTEFIVSNDVKNISSPRVEKKKWIPWTHEPILKRENSSFANIKIIDDFCGQWHYAGFISLLQVADVYKTATVGLSF